MVRSDFLFFLNTLILLASLADSPSRLFPLSSFTQLTPLTFPAPSFKDITAYLENTPTLSIINMLITGYSTSPITPICQFPPSLRRHRRIWHTTLEEARSEDNDSKYTGFDADDTNVWSSGDSENTQQDETQTDTNDTKTVSTFTASQRYSVVQKIITIGWTNPIIPTSNMQALFPISPAYFDAPNVTVSPRVYIQTKRQRQAITPTFVKVRRTVDLEDSTRSGFYG